MEIVGGAASIAQLTAYSHVVVKQLLELYEAAREGPSYCQLQRSNINFLLKAVQRLGTNETPDLDSVLPLLIATANLASLLLNLLKPKGHLYSWFLWISKSQEIETAFRSLNDKIRLLQLHLAERTYNIVAHVSQDIKEMSQTITTQASPTMPLALPLDPVTHPSPTRNSDMDTTPKTDTKPKAAQEGHVSISASGSEAGKGATQHIANGWGDRGTSAEVTANNSKASENAEQAVAQAKWPTLNMQKRRSTPQNQ